MAPLQQLSSANGPRHSPDRRPSSDRFIPSRLAMDLSISSMEVERGAVADQPPHELNASPAKEEYKRRLASNLFAGDPDNNRVLAFNSPPRKKKADADTLRTIYTANRMRTSAPRRSGRLIPQAPERILDAPDLLDDYYLNLLDWNADNILGARPSRARACRLLR